jgi:hypothetical protein
MALVTLNGFEEGPQPATTGIPEGSLRNYAGDTLFMEENTFGHVFQATFVQDGGNNPGTAIYVANGATPDVPYFPDGGGVYCGYMASRWICSASLVPANAIGFDFVRQDYSDYDWDLEHGPSSERISTIAISWSDPWVADAGGVLGARVEMDMSLESMDITEQWWTGTSESEQTRSSLVAIPHDEVPVLGEFDPAVYVTHPALRLRLIGSTWELSEASGSVIASAIIPVTPPETGLRYSFSITVNHTPVTSSPDSRNGGMLLDNIVGELGLFREENIEGVAETFRARFTGT